MSEGAFDSFSCRLSPAWRDEWNICVRNYGEGKHMMTDVIPSNWRRKAFSSRRQAARGRVVLFISWRTGIITVHPIQQPADKTVVDAPRFHVDENHEIFRDPGPHSPQS